jgi:hypothetical protein
METPNMTFFCGAKYAEINAAAMDESHSNTIIARGSSPI